MSPARSSGRIFRFILAAASCLIVLGCAIEAWGQDNGLERSFPQSKAAIESALRQMNPATAGRLPVLEGFATSAEHPLENYRRGYYQAKFRVSELPSGGSTVRVTVEITAWFADPRAAGTTSANTASGGAVSGRPGYQLLKSNGRLEADMLDQLTDQLAQAGAGAGSETIASRQPVVAEPAPASAKPAAKLAAKNDPRVASATTAPGAAAPASSASSKAATEPGSGISAPMPQLPENNSRVDSGLAQGVSGQVTPPGGSGKMGAEDDRTLRSEVENLEEILKNQAHPKNLVAVKKSGTPVVDSESLNAKTLFLASAHDEFELIDYGRDWVHVRISGISRGWIWRSSLEMPDGIPDVDAAPDAMPAASDLFHVSREETAQFPGDWPPLRGRNVKIVSVEKTSEEKEAGPQLKLEFVKSLFDQNFAQLTQKAGQLAGIVVIFDSADGGMIAAPVALLQQWKAGTLSDAALWHQCFFDPPETFNASTVSPAQ